ncbi:subtilase-type protease inhibitor [Streptomyces sp. DT2A-34]|uniref:subtilase-type protease inhibitor n=1 Tax=Streptomyces sp. DT2A-34 TaxID=3051182 RepID=UPI00265C7850|nr:subtilase-type protease inhibitor [Streptomyces sp. DT2A-34]MDO0909396.1 subtilase-type protease inhibitor [Streptomyces sp. DT2A-34]
MRPMTRWAMTGVLLTAALTGPLAMPAHSAPAALYAPSALVLTTGHGENAATTAPERAVTVNCAYTTSGTHPDPRQACTDLDRVNGDLERLATLRADGTGRHCTKEYRPVVVTVQGVWRGTRVNYEHTFANPCIKETQGASVFAF